VADARLIEGWAEGGQGWGALTLRFTPFFTTLVRLLIEVFVCMSNVFFAVD